MLKYQRNKLVSVDRVGPDALEVRGVLDDDLYGLEIDLEVGLSDLVIRSIAGRWHRWTTPECPRALDHLQPAVGWKIEPGLRGRIQKVIGRGACRHFANLLLEMCHSAKQAAVAMEYEAALADDPELNLEDFLAGRRPRPSPRENEPAPPPPSGHGAPPRIRRGSYTGIKSAGGSVIDLHTHSWPASPCSTISADDLAAEAKRVGLDGFCLTDHNVVWPAEEVGRLSETHGLLVLRGNEIITDQGDALVFGYHEEVTGVIKLERLREAVRAAGGFTIMAHPFRGFLVFDPGKVGLTVEQAAQRPMFQHVDALEVGNGKVTEAENRFAAQVAQTLNLPGLAGSDAHETGSIGQYATWFYDPITSEADLVAALRSGRFEAVQLEE